APVLRRDGEAVGCLHPYRLELLVLRCSLRCRGCGERSDEQRHKRDAGKPAAKRCLCHEGPPCCGRMRSAWIAIGHRSSLVARYRPACTLRIDGATKKRFDAFTKTERGCGRCPSSLPTHPAAVVGSIILRTSVIFVAGKPLISACLRMMASSLAR